MPVPLLLISGVVCTQSPPTPQPVFSGSRCSGCLASGLFLAAQNPAVPLRVLGGAVSGLSAAETEVIAVGIASKPRNVLLAPIKGFCALSGFKKQSGRRRLEAKMLEFWMFGFLWE